jgi:hypothetical protein
MQNTLLASFFAQVCMAALALAAPITEEAVHKTDAWQYGTGGGIIGLIVLVLDIIVFGMSAPFLSALPGSTNAPC